MYEAKFYPLEGIAIAGEYTTHFTGSGNCTSEPTHWGEAPKEPVSSLCITEAVPANSPDYTKPYIMVIPHRLRELVRIHGDITKFGYQKQKQEGE